MSCIDENVNHPRSLDPLRLNAYKNIKSLYDVKDSIEFQFGDDSIEIEYFRSVINLSQDDRIKMLESIKNNINHVYIDDKKNICNLIYDRINTKDVENEFWKILGLLSSYNFSREERKDCLKVFTKGAMVKHREYSFTFDQYCLGNNDEYISSYRRNIYNRIIVDDMKRTDITPFEGFTIWLNYRQEAIDFLHLEHLVNHIDIADFGDRNLETSIFSMLNMLMFNDYCKFSVMELFRNFKNVKKIIHDKRTYYILKLSNHLRFQQIKGYQRLKEMSYNKDMLGFTFLPIRLGKAIFVIQYI